MERVEPEARQQQGGAEQRRVEHAASEPGQAQLHADQEDGKHTDTEQQFGQRLDTVGSVPVIGRREVTEIGLVEGEGRGQHGLLHQVRGGPDIGDRIGGHSGASLAEQTKIDRNIALDHVDRIFLFSAVGHVFARGDQRVRHRVRVFLDRPPGGLGGVVLAEDGVGQIGVEVGKSGVDLFGRDDRRDSVATDRLHRIVEVGEDGRSQPPEQRAGGEQEQQRRLETARGDAKARSQTIRAGGRGDNLSRAIDARIRDRHAGSSSGSAGTDGDAGPAAQGELIAICERRLDPRL